MTKKLDILVELGLLAKIYDNPIKCAAIDAANEISMLRATEEGAKEAFSVLVQQKQDAEAECKKFRGLLDRAYAQIRQQA